MGANFLYDDRRQAAARCGADYDHRHGRNTETDTQDYSFVFLDRRERFRVPPGLSSSIASFNPSR